MSGPRPEAVRLADYLTYRHHGPGSVAAACRRALHTPCSVGLTLAADATMARRICLCSDGPLADAGEQLQCNLGEGPCVQALQQRAPVLVEDLNDPHTTRQWPLFALEAQTRGIQAAFALPARQSTGRGGLVLSLYRDRPGPL
ncbi:GAF domain-containing protein, partial [Streptomyces apricus]|uniref:GAF domain-containing protein n=1 Tax=Streptomyces apricus TaxID=1828112 RepID=UPI0016600523